MLRTRSILLALAATLAAGIAAAAAEPRANFEVLPIVIAPNEAALAAPPPGVSTNANGDVLFTFADMGVESVYLRVDAGFRLRLLGRGDPLAGSEVTRVVASASSLDAFRRVVLWVALADGRAGLFRLSPPPSAFAVNPRHGDRSEPIAFHIMGDGFTPGLEVHFGEAKAGFVTVLSRTELTGLVPAGQPAGTVDVTIARPGGGKATLPKAFEFRDRPTSGCQDLFPDHRPPADRTSSAATPWLGVAAALALCGRRAGRRHPSGRP